VLERVDALREDRERGAAEEQPERLALPAIAVGSCTRGRQRLRLVQAETESKTFLDGLEPDFVVAHDGRQMRVPLGDQSHRRLDLLDHDVKVAADGFFLLTKPRVDLLEPRVYLVESRTELTIFSPQFGEALNDRPVQLVDRHRASILPSSPMRISYRIANVRILQRCAVWLVGWSAEERRNCDAG
jgi:hypothetical protein